MSKPTNSELDQEVGRALDAAFRGWGVTVAHHQLGDVMVHGEVVNEKGFGILAGTLRACLHSNGWKLVRDEPIGVLGCDGDHGACQTGCRCGCKHSA